MLRALIPLAAVLGLIFWASGRTLGVAACVVAEAYFVSLVVHPNRDCISCGGHKSHSPEGSKNFRRCWTCKGAGYYPRLGVRLLRRDVYKKIRAGKHGRNF